jgi:acyl-CoA dehydrogenase
MALVLNEEQVMLRDAARDFLNSRAPVSHFRELRDQRDETGFSTDLWREMVDMGWSSIIIPEKFGGLDYGYTGLGLVLEECGRTLSPSPLISTALMGASALLLSENARLCKEWLPGIAGGVSLLAPAFEESPMHRPASVETTAVPDVVDFLISGSKVGVMDGKTADAFVISAMTEGWGLHAAGMTLFLVPANSVGLQLSATATLDNRHLCSLELNNVRVSAANMIGPPGGGLQLLDAVLDRGRIGMAAELLGIAQETFERTVQYLKERRQFGVPIGSFQALQHRAARLFGEIELCKSVVLRALQAIDEDSPEVPMLASLAKAKCSQTAELATAEAIQMHGGIGMTDEFDLGFFIKRWRALNQQLGDSRYHLDRFATLRGY